MVYLIFIFKSDKEIERQENLILLYNLTSEQNPIIYLVIQELKKLQNTFEYIINGCRKLFQDQGRTSSSTFMFSGLPCSCLVGHLVHFQWTTLFMFCGPPCSCLVGYLVHVQQATLFMFSGLPCSCLVGHLVHVQWSTLYFSLF